MANKKGGKLPPVDYAKVASETYSIDVCMQYAEEGEPLVMTMQQMKLMTAMKKDEKPFAKHVPTLVKWLTTDPKSGGNLDSRASAALQILQNLAQYLPREVGKYTKDFIPLLSDPMNSLVMMMLSHIAKGDVEAVAPHVDAILASLEESPMNSYYAWTIVGAVGATSPERAKHAVAALDKNLDPDSLDMTSGIALLQAAQVIGEKQKGALLPLADKLKRMEKHSDMNVRTMAKHCNDTLAGLTVRNLAASVEEQNKKIAAAATDMDSLQAYLDENVSMMKDFIADVVKKLPMPAALNVTGKVRKKMELHFVCSRCLDKCQHDKEHPFITTTNEWNKWLKVGMSAAKIGVSILTLNALAIPGQAISAAKAVYGALKSKKDPPFLKFASEPFLTSDESDGLIKQLREAGFFKAFQYNAQDATWMCNSCAKAPASKAAGRAGTTKTGGRRRVKSKTRDDTSSGGHDAAALGTDDRFNASAPSALAPMEVAVRVRAEGSTGAWASQWMSFDGRKICMYKDMQAVLLPPIDVFDIRECVTVRAIDDKRAGAKHAFLLTTRAKSLVLAAPDDATRKTWVHAFLTRMPSS